MADATPEGWVTDHASTVAAFYKALVDGGVPEVAATGLAQEFNHQSLRAHFRE